MYSSVLVLYFIAMLTATSDEDARPDAMAEDDGSDDQRKVARSDDEAASALAKHLDLVEVKVDEQQVRGDD